MDNIRKIWHNPLLKETHERRRKEIIIRFPELKESSHDLFLSLYKYIEHIPERFYSEKTYNKYLRYLGQLNTTHRNSLYKYLNKYEKQINKSFIFMAEENKNKWHDTIEAADDYEKIRTIDKDLIPTYLRIIEAVYYPLIHLIAVFSRKKREKM
jgi:hypothetical protein